MKNRANMESAAGGDADEISAGTAFLEDIRAIPGVSFYGGKRMKITKIEHKQENKIYRVAAYARVSTLKEEQEESYETQIEYYTRLIQSTVGWEFAGMYADKGITGLSAAMRPGFMQMIEDGLNGGFDILLVKSISRFARNSLEAQLYVHKLKEKGVEVRFEREAISSMDPTAEMIFNFMTAIAQEESRSISANCILALEKKAEKGERKLGPNRVLGYTQQDGELVPNQDAWIPKQALEEYAAGVPVSEILEHLNAKGAKTQFSKTDIKFSTINRIINNEIYVGDRIIQKEPHINYLTKKPDPTIDYHTVYVENAHEPIVSRETWNKVQERKKKTAQGKPPKPKKEKCVHNAHFMYGRIYCGECGTPFIRDVWRARDQEKTKHIIWTCRGRRRKEVDCVNLSVPEEELFRTLAETIDIAWPGYENCTVETFKSIKRVDIFYDRHIEVTVSE